MQVKVGGGEGDAVMCQDERGANTWPTEWKNQIAYLVCVCVWNKSASSSK